MPEQQLPRLNPFSGYVRNIDRNNNMGLVRYILAIGVLIAHFNVLCGADIPWIVTEQDRVGGFFTLSGFLLVAPILKGTTFRTFAIRRCWRILPSYIFVVVITALVLVFFSTLTPAEYFTSGGFWKYMAANLSFLNFLCPDLPGVFTNLSLPAVNGALWTMKVEWQLTLTLPFFLWLIGRYNLNLRKCIILILVVSLIYRYIFNNLYSVTEKPIYEILGRQFFGQSLFFYFGVLLYTCYETLKKNWKWVFVISVVIYVIFRLTAFNPVYFDFFHPFVISLLVLSASLIPGDVMKRIDRGNNISYELYLWHFPVVQLIASWNLVDRWGVMPAFILACTTVLVLAVVTWFTVGHLYTTRNKKTLAKTS